MKITVGVKAGLEKQTCDDAAIIDDRIINNAAYECETDAFQIVGIADGVGGNSGGKEASMFIMKQLINAGFKDDSNIIKEKLIDINNMLLEYADSTIDKKRMATTLSAISFVGRDYFLIHIGNTRIYVGQGGYLKQITQDHTTYQWLLSHGRTDAAESCNKNEISACLGGGKENLIQQIEIRQIFENGLPNCVVFSSDGVHEYVEIDRLEEMIFSGKADGDIVKEIIDEAEKCGSHDDKTVLIIRR